jgi:hypothetical protein
MNLTVNRNISDDTSTEGDFIEDGARIAYSLERPWMNGSNEHGVACILPGTYEVQTDFSPHFNKIMPILLNVPGRSEIRIHPANWPSQLEGCIAIGLKEDKDAIENSVAAFEPFFFRLEEALKVGKVFITITNQF